jgi:hypothetical protein
MWKVSMKHGMKLLLFAAAVLCLRAQKPTAAEIVDVSMIWGRAPHNAFTDLVRFRERWYCVFREGRDPVSPDGAIRVLTSADATTWQPVALLTLAGADLRDPKLSVTPRGLLFLNAVAVYREPSGVRHQSLVWTSYDAREWDGPMTVGDPNFCPWRVTWNGTQAYSAGYGTEGTPSLRLYAGTEGAKFNLQASNLFDGDRPTEASLLFLPDGIALCLLRTGGATPTSVLGKSRAPYRGWSWTNLKTFLSGPNLIRLPDERYVAGGGMTAGNARTSLAWLDPDAGTLREFLVLPSGGDTGYPGLAFHDGLLYVSYYSSHEGHAMIYLAKVKLAPPGAAPRRNAYR